MIETYDEVIKAGEEQGAGKTLSEKSKQAPLKDPSNPDMRTFVYSFQ